MPDKQKDQSPPEELEGLIAEKDEALAARNARIAELEQALSGKDEQIAAMTQSAAAVALSPRGYRGRRVAASPEEILKAARHLADHYRKANKPLPDTLAALG